MLNLRKSSLAIAILSVLLLILTISPVSEFDSVDSYGPSTGTIIGDMYAVISVVSVYDDLTYGFMMIDHKQGSEVVFLYIDSIVSMASYHEDKPFVFCVSFADNTIPRGTEADINFMALKKTTLLGNLIYKPVPVTRTITVPDGAGDMHVIGFNLNDILDGRYSVVSVVSVMDGTQYGFMTIDHRRADL